MLAIRMQRTGRKGHAMFRVVVQDSRVTPTSGKVVAYLGSYDPHAKTIVLDKEKAATFLKNGAQPSDRAAGLLKKEGVKLPKWVEIDTKKAGKLRNPVKLRKHQPKDVVKAEEPAATEPEAAVEAAEVEAPVTESPETTEVAEPTEQASEAAEVTEAAETEAAPAEETPTEVAEAPATEATPEAETTPAEEPTETPTKE